MTSELARCACGATWDPAVQAHRQCTLRSNLQTCPECHNSFVQPFVCTTCGAQKLYDETVRSQASEIERLRTENESLSAESRKNFACAVSLLYLVPDSVRVGEAQELLTEYRRWRDAVETTVPIHPTGYMGGINASEDDK